MTIVLQFFPNGEFSQGVDTSKRRRDKRTQTLTQTLKLNIQRRDEYLQWIQNNADIQNQITIAKEYDIWVSPCGNQYSVGELHHDSCTLDWRDKTGRPYRTYVPKSFRVVVYEWRLTPLVHQSVESSKLTPSRKKLETMTKNMARNIRQGVFVLEQVEGGKDLLSFLTLTLPGLSQQGLRKCCEKWDYMVNRFFSWLRTKLEDGGVEFKYVYCTEVQSKRLQRRDEYAPHLHVVFRGRIGKKCPWIISPRQARKAWAACISSVVSEPFRDNALENIQRIKYSAARYLSKYLSKGRCAIPAKSGQDAILALRTQWGGMARAISRDIRCKTIKLSGDRGNGALVVAVLNRMEALVGCGLVLYFKRGFIPLGTDKTTGMEYGLHVGCGCLSAPTHQGGYDAIMGTF